MGELIGLPVDAQSANFLVVEVDDAEPSGGLVLAAAPGLAKGIAMAQITLEEALDKLRPSLQKIANVLKDLAPEEAEVEFGLKIGGETGVIIAKGTAEVNFVIRMTWKTSRSAPSGSAQTAAPTSQVLQ